MLSVGTDIVEIKKIETTCKNEALLHKIFTEEEISYARSKNCPAETFAGLFASKEATLKSLKRGLDGSPLKDIEIIHIDRAPVLRLHGKIKEETDDLKLNFSLSISHDGDYAIATVIAFSN